MNSVRDLLWCAGVLSLAAVPGAGQSVSFTGDAQADQNAVVGSQSATFSASSVNLGTDNFNGIGLSQGRLTIADGGSVDVFGIVQAGDSRFGLGLIEVQGFGSQLVANDIAVENGALLVTGGANVSAGLFGSVGPFSSGSSTDGGSGRLEVDGFGSVFSGEQALVLTAGSALVANGGRLDFRSIDVGPAFSSFDLVVGSGGQVAAENDVQIGGDGRSEVRVESGGTLSARDVTVDQASSIRLEGGRLEASGRVVVNSGADLSGYGDIAGAVELDFNGGNEPAGRLSVDQGRTLRISDGGNFQAALDNDGRIENRGTLDLGGGRLINGGEASLLSFGGTLRAAEIDNLGGAIDLVSGVNLIDGDVVNDEGGRITLTGGASGVFAGEVDNDSQIRTESGSTATFLDEVSGSGSFDGAGSVVFLDTFSPGNSPALVTFGGDLTFGENSETIIELEGTQRGTQHDAFDVAGTLTLNGRFEITLLGDFLPQLGDRFEVFNAGEIVGNFSGFDIPSLANGLSFDVSELESGGVVTVIPEPATAVLLGLMAGAGVLRRRRA